MKNLTPEHMRCVTGTCPGVYELTDGLLIIVGACAYGNGLVECGKGETAIIIDRALLSEVLQSEREACAKKVQFYLDTSLVPLEFYAGKSAEWADAIKECRELIGALRDKSAP